MRLMVTGLLATIGSIGALYAQDWTGAGGVSSRVNFSDPGAAFRATIERKPTRELYVQGRLVAMGGGRGGPAVACLTCHGPSGAGDSSGAFPRLSAFPAWYMYKQLGDYASGARPNDVMSPIAQQLSAMEREAVSVFYALSLAPPQFQPDPKPNLNVLQWGAALSAVGSAERGIPACVNCHGALGEGLPPSVPNLAGQHAAYIRGQLLLWQEGVRRNDPMNVMKVIADKMTAEDIDAVAAYFSSLQPSGTAAVRAER